MTLLTMSSDTRITGATSGVIKKLQERLTFRNPKHEENERKGFSNWNIPRELCYLEQDTGSLAFPRGFTRQALSIIRNSGQQVRLQDNRRRLSPVELVFHGNLRDHQQDAAAGDPQARLWDRINSNGRREDRSLRWRQ